MHKEKISVDGKKMTVEEAIAVAVQHLMIFEKSPANRTMNFIFYNGHVNAWLLSPTEPSVYTCCFLVGELKNHPDYKKSFWPNTGDRCAILSRTAQNDTWKNCVINYMGKHLCVYTCEGEEFERQDGINFLIFKPEITEQSVAFDELKADLKDWVIDPLALKRLIKLGYRKPK